MWSRDWFRGIRTSRTVGTTGTIANITRVKPIATRKWIRNGNVNGKYTGILFEKKCKSKERGDNVKFARINICQNFYSVVTFIN